MIRRQNTIKVGSPFVMAVLILVIVISNAAMVKAATIKISSKSITLETKKTKTLKISGTKRKITWRTSKKSVATVSSTGKVTAKTPGTAVITASVSGKKLTTKVTVKKPIKISHSTYTLEAGKAKTFKVTGTTKKPTWITNKKSVATVSSTGKVTAKAPGTAVITASVAGKKLTTKVTVKRPKVTPPPTKVVGYYAAWASYSGFTPSKLDATKLTHINYAFANISSNLKVTLGYPDIDQRNINELNQLKKTYPHLKTMIAIGGWTWSGRFSDAALTDSSRTAFADSCVDFVVKYGFDGVDIDWEYPVSGGLSTNTRRPDDKYNFTLLMEKIREKLNARGKIDNKTYTLSFAGATGSWYLNNIEASKISQYVDYINVMTYDIHGTWESYTDFNAPLYNSSTYHQPYQVSVDTSIKAWIHAGVPKNKLVMGVPFYGYLYNQVSNINKGLYQTYSGGYSISYEKIAAYYLSNSKFTKHYHSESKVPWLFNGSTFITYENQDSMMQKALYIKNNGLGGAMVWELSQDPNNVLLNSLYNGLK